MNGWERSAVCTMLMMSMIVCILFCSVGCGVRQKDRTEDVSQVATGPAVYIDEKQDSEAVRHQLELLVKNADKWRIEGDADGNNSDEINYAVTDLDHNGRLEILVDEDRYDAEESAYLRCYEVNESGDGIEEIDTDQAGEDFLDNLEYSDTAYCDPKTGEYHYVRVGGCVEYDLEEDDTEETEKEGWITAWTLKEGQITRDVLGYWVEIAEEEGGTEDRYYHVNDKNTYLRKEEYSEVNPEDVSYSGCGKLTVRISEFFFDHSLEDMTEKQMYHALEKSYEEFFGGYPLEKRKMSVSGQKVAIPQYRTIRDSGKQKRVNQMIYDWDVKDADSGIAYSDVDWEAYQYKLLAPEYQRLQDYMPVLTGETELIWEPYMLEIDEWKDQWLYSIAFCDVTQDGQLELILQFSSMGGFYLILHQEGERFYGIDLPVRWFVGLQENGLYYGSSGYAKGACYQMRFDGDTFVTEELARCDGDLYSIGGKKVEEKEYEKWEEDNALNSPECKYYTPEAL